MIKVNDILYAKKRLLTLFIFNKAKKKTLIIGDRESSMIGSRYNLNQNLNIFNLLYTWVTRKCHLLSNEVSLVSVKFNYGYSPLS